MTMQGVNYATKPVTRAKNRRASLGNASVDFHAGKRGLSDDAIAAIMSEAVLDCLRLFDPATTKRRVSEMSTDRGHHHPAGRKPYPES